MQSFSQYLTESYVRTPLVDNGGNDLIFDDNYNKRAKPFFDKFPKGVWVSHIDDFKKIILTRKWNNVFLDNDIDIKISYKKAEEQQYQNSGYGVVDFIIKNKPIINRIIVHTGNKHSWDLMVQNLTKAGYNVKRIGAPLLRFNNFDIDSLWEKDQDFIDSQTVKNLKESIDITGDDKEISDLFRTVELSKQTRHKTFKEYKPKNLKIKCDFDYDPYFEKLMYRSNVSSQIFGDLGHRTIRLLDGTTYSLVFLYQPYKESDFCRIMSPQIVNWIKYNKVKFDRMTIKGFLKKLTDLIFESNYMYNFKANVVIIPESRSQFVINWYNIIKDKYCTPSHIRVYSNKTQDSRTMLPYLKKPETNSPGTINVFNQLKKQLSSGKKIDAKNLPSSFRRYIYGGFHLFEDQYELNKLEWLRKKKDKLNILILDDSASVSAVTIKSIIQDLHEKLLNNRDPKSYDIRAIVPFLLP